MIVYPVLGLSSFVVAWALGEIGRIVDRRHRRDDADVARITSGYAAAPREQLTEEIPVYAIGHHPRHVPDAADLEPWPLPPVQHCEPPDWYVPILDRPAEFDRLMGVEFPLCSYVESAT